MIYIKLNINKMAIAKDVDPSLRQLRRFTTDEASAITPLIPTSDSHFLQSALTRSLKGTHFLPKCDISLPNESMSLEGMRG